MSTIFPLSHLEQRAKTHAVLCSVGFLIFVPIGVLVARYTRTFSKQWFYGHAFIQLVISAPIIWAGFNFGHQTATELGLQHYRNHHGQIGLGLLILYVLQLICGLVIHFVKIPSPSPLKGIRPQNCFHIGLGILILGIAHYQVFYGLHTEWPNATGGLHPVPTSAYNAWYALVIIFWALYFAGYAFYPKQLAQENNARDSQF